MQSFLLTPSAILNTDLCTFSRVPTHLHSYPVCAARTKILFSTEARGLSKGKERGEAVQSGANTSAKIDLTVQGAVAKVGSNPKCTSIHSHTITCDYVVAADGAGSKIRSMVGLGLSGRQGIAHLVNVHFRCKPLAHLLRVGGPRPPGMLYFVYNEVRGRGIIRLLTRVDPSSAADQL